MCRLLVLFFLSLSSLLFLILHSSSSFFQDLLHRLILVKDSYCDGGGMRLTIARSKTFKAGGAEEEAEVYDPERGGFTALKRRSLADKGTDAHFLKQPQDDRFQVQLSACVCVLCVCCAFVVIVCAHRHMYVLRDCLFSLFTLRLLYYIQLLGEPNSFPHLPQRSNVCVTMCVTM